MKNLFYLFASFSILLISCEKEEYNSAEGKEQTDAVYAYSKLYALNICDKDVDGTAYWGVKCVPSVRAQCPDQLECTPLLEYGNPSTDFGIELADIYGYDKVDDFIDAMNSGAIDINDEPNGIELIQNELGFE